MVPSSLLGIHFLTPYTNALSIIFRHTGCTCPPEFTGPHCEFLNLELAVANNTEDEDDNRSLVAFYVVFILGLATLGLLVIRKVRTRYQRAHIRNSLSIPPDGINLNSYADEDEGIFSDPHEEEDHDSSSSSDEYQDALPPIA